jgi:uncharacterized protein YutE (UPF0331/DUF86 family)
MSEVSDVMLNVEHALDRAKKAKKRLGASAEEHNAQLALEAAIDDLERVLKSLRQDAYFAGDELRLM